MYPFARHTLCLIFLLFQPLVVFGQNNAYRQYIETYKEMAIDQMHRYGIPASITLAQGLLESGAGNSTLTRKANNHFGIKVGMNWTGPYVLQDDDAKGEKFRKYRNAAESYEDHSLFLKNGRRYASLFTLKSTDYKGWAHGLKKAGYATNPKYAQLLIHIIETYDLTRFDHASRHSRNRHGKSEERFYAASAYEVRRCNKNYYVIAKQGDTFNSIGKAMGISARKLRRYNEVDKRYVLQEGDIVYLEKKQKRADKQLKNQFHEVQAGESMYSIAQQYGMRLETLYKTNKLPADHAVSAGELLKIR